MACFINLNTVLFSAGHKVRGRGGDRRHEFLGGHHSARQRLRPRGGHPGSLPLRQRVSAS